MGIRFNRNVVIKGVLCVVLVAALGYSFVAKSETKLLPFQGRLTDSSGEIISDGPLVVQFKMYDEQIAGRAVWEGEEQRLSVYNGLVSTVLGMKSSLAKVDFSKPVYLEITVDANGDDKIGLEDPPLLPRQVIIPAVYAVKAGNADKLNGYDWSDVFSKGDVQNGRISGDKLEDGSITSAKLANGTIDSAQLADKVADTKKIADKAVIHSKIMDGAIKRENLEASLVEIIDSLKLSEDMKIPPGMIVPFSGKKEKVPDGWLLCDGSVVSSQEYPDLFKAIGTSWGGGYTRDLQSSETKGNGDFNLPDLRGMFLRGVNGNKGGDCSDHDANTSTNIVSGGNIRDRVGSYQQSEFTSHSHRFAGDDYTPIATRLPDSWNYDVWSGGDGGGSFRTKPDPDYPISQETRSKNAYVNYIIKF